MQRSEYSELKPNTARALMQGFFGALFILAIVAFLVVLAGPARGADSNKRFFDREQLQVATGTATINSATATYSNWQPLITFTMDGATAAQDIDVILDLNQASTGFGAVYTSATINVTWARKVDGTNWRVETNSTSGTVSGTTASASTGGLAVRLHCPVASPGESLACYVIISSVNATNVTIPYVVYYRAGVKATITAAS
jgi:hypothetical protein